MASWEPAFRSPSGKPSPFCSNTKSGTAAWLRGPPTLRSSLLQGRKATIIITELTEHNIQEQKYLTLPVGYDKLLIADFTRNFTDTFYECLSIHYVYRMWVRTICSPCHCEGKLLLACIAHRDMQDSSWITAARHYCLFQKEMCVN